MDKTVKKLEQTAPIAKVLRGALWDNRSNLRIQTNWHEVCFTFFACSSRKRGCAPVGKQSIQSKVAKITLSAPHVFDSAAFPAIAGLGRSVVRLQPKEFFFSQGDPADSVFYLQKGRAKVSVVSKTGKEATIALLAPHAFVGEEALAAMPSCLWCN